MPLGLAAEWKTQPELRAVSGGHSTGMGLSAVPPFWDAGLWAHTFSASEPWFSVDCDPQCLFLPEIADIENLPAVLS